MSAIATVLDTTALTALKYGGTTNSSLFFAGGVLAGAAAYYTMGAVITISGQAKGNTMWNVYSTIASTLIGYFIWQEDISPKNLLGIGVSCFGIYLMNSN